MCTLSIIPLGAGYRAVVNRDESRTRAEALAPRWRALAGPGARKAIWPTDPAGGGTWVGANDAGLMLALLNYNPVPADRARPGSQSRGAVIPMLIGAETPAQVVQGLKRIALSDFAPFRLVAVVRGAGQVLVAQESAWNGGELLVRSPIQAPACFASSGLGDAVVRPRLDLFAQLLNDEGPTPMMQDRFHRHEWPGRPEISVMMSREAARTVSITDVLVSGGGVSMRYSPVPARAQRDDPHRAGAKV